MTVTADDGVQLHAEIYGDPHAPVTAVLCHGYTLNRNSWYFQRAELAKRARVVAWDQRGHGCSGQGDMARMTIDQLGRDLYAVLERTTQEGPVVLIGHSMGGMSILALAEQHPGLFGDRVVGVALVTTPAGPITASIGLPTPTASVLDWAAPQVLSLGQYLRLIPGCANAVRQVAQLFARYSFASSIPKTLLGFIANMIESTSVEAVMELLPQFFAFDKRTVLPVLDQVDTVVLAAENDLVVSPEHGRSVARAVANARFVLIPHAGHGVPLEDPHPVNTELDDLLTRVTSCRAPRSVAVQSILALP